MTANIISGAFHRFESISKQFRGFENFQIIKLTLIKNPNNSSYVLVNNE